VVEEEKDARWCGAEVVKQVGVVAVVIVDMGGEEMLPKEVATAEWGETW
jgi:hypothetical protein